MALYQSVSVVWQVATDSTLAQLMSSRSLNSTDSTGILEYTSQVIKIADLVTDQAISLGGLAGIKALLVKSDRQITLKLDGESVVIGHTKAEGGLLILCPADDIAAVLVSNGSGSSAEVHIEMAGA